MNPLYQMYAPKSQQNNLIQRFQQFQKTFSGDPREQIQKLMQSGKISQEDYNRAYQMAQQLQGMLRF